MRSDVTKMRGRAGRKGGLLFLAISLAGRAKERAVGQASAQETREVGGGGCRLYTVVDC